MKTLKEYEELEIWCRTALAMAPKWSPYKVLWRLGIWHAKRKQRGK